MDTLHIQRDYDTAHASGGTSWVDGWTRRPAYAHDHYTDENGDRQHGTPYTWRPDYRGVAQDATALLQAAGFDAAGNDPHAPTDVDADGYATTLDYAAGHASGLTTDEINAAHHQRGEATGSITVIPGDPLRDRHSRSWEVRGTADARRYPRPSDITITHPDGTTETLPAALHDANGRRNANQRHATPEQAEQAKREHAADRNAKRPSFRCADCRRPVRARDERITDKVCRACGEQRMATPVKVHDLTNL